MKTWQTVSILALSVAIAAAGWLFSSPEKPQPEVAHKATAPIRETAVPKRTEVPVKVRPSADRRRADVFDFADSDRDEKDLNLAFGDDFKFEEEIKEKLSEVMQQIYDEYLVASKREDRKAMLAAIQKMLGKVQAGQSVPHWLKDEMIDGIKWVGSSALPELIAMAADADAEVADSALEALQELLWDFDTTSQQVADALLQVVRLSTDKSVIEPFVNEMMDMPTDLKVKTALAVIDSGNAAATECLMENVDFIFDDFDGKIKTREDIAAYGGEGE